MIIKNRFWGLAGLLWLLGGCHADQSTRVIAPIQSGHGKKVYLERIPYGQEEARIEDSATAEDMTRDLVFRLHGQEQRLYQLRFPGAAVRFIFINDGPQVTLSGNFLTGRYTVDHSPSSSPFKAFLHGQSALSCTTP